MAIFWLNSFWHTLFVHLLRSRVRSAASSLFVLLAGLGGLFVAHLYFESLFRSRLPKRLLQWVAPIGSTDYLVREFADDLVRLIFGHFWYVVLAGILFLGIVFLCANVVLFILSLLIEGALLPRAIWSWIYLDQRERCERVIFKPMIASGVLFIFIVIWLAAQTRESLNNIVALMSNSLLIAIACIATFDYVIQAKLGFLRYLATSAPTFWALVRVLLARISYLVVFVMILFIAFSAMRALLIPNLISRIEGIEISASARFATFVNAATQARVPTEAIEVIAHNFTRVKAEALTRRREILARGAETLIESGKSSVGILFFIALLTEVYFPLVYTKVRLVPLATGIILLSLIAVELVLPGIMSEVFRIGGHGPTGVVVVIGMVVVFGEVVTALVGSVFRRESPCGRCGSGNLLWARFCSACGCRLVKPSPPGEYIGNQETGYVHLPSCPVLRKLRKPRLVILRSVDEAERQNYRRCGVCMKA